MGSTASLRRRSQLHQNLPSKSQYDWCFFRSFNCRRRPSKATAARTLSFKETAPYQPPSGFELASLDEPSSASQLLTRWNLEGKEIWYITTPASVPISSIREASLANLKQGSAILSHHDNNYGFIQGSSEDVTYTKVMVPNSAEDGYRASNYTLFSVDHGTTNF